MKKSIVISFTIFLLFCLKSAYALPDLYIDIWWGYQFPQSLCAYSNRQWECIQPTYTYEPTYMVNIISNDTFCLTSLKRYCQILMTICNLGDSPLPFCIYGASDPFFKLTIYDEKNNTVFSAFNNFICAGGEASLPPGYCLPSVPYSYTLENFIPQLPPGTYYVYVIADPNNFWNETDENNNLLIIKLTILGSPTPPPCKICNVSAIPTSIENYPIKFLCLFFNLFCNPIFSFLVLGLILFSLILLKVMR